MGLGFRGVFRGTIGKNGQILSLFPEKIARRGIEALEEEYIHGIKNFRGTNAKGDPP
jgi:hypothetical protein